jgi:succinoglycan biosynthesis transport protein ExoP
MLSPDKIARAEFNFSDESVGNFVDIDKALSAVRRQWRVVLATTFVLLLLGVVYALTAVPQYTAESNILIDKDAGQVVSQLSSISESATISDDDASMLSQVELLKSDAILFAVIDKLKLLEDPHFTAQPNSALSLLKGVLDFRSWFASDDVAQIDDARKREAAAAAIVRNMTVERVGRTYVLTITYTSPFPDLSASIANTIADTYLLDKLNSRYEATRRASDWLQQRIDELKQQALDSDLAVQKFKAQNGLLSISGTGQLLSDQQLTQLSAALIEAQGDTAKAQARYGRIESIISSNRTDAIVSDVLDSSTINDLRKKYLDASKLESDISARLGPNHEQAVRLRGEMQEYQRLMFEELGRIAQSYKSELDVAQNREKSLQDNLSSAQGVSAVAGETQVQLRELERSADAYKSLYQTFLERFQQATQQQSFPISDSRIIKRAVEPNAPSKPKKALVLAIFGVLGFALGCCVGGVREFRDRFFRTGDQIRDELAIEYLGVAPLVKEKASATDKESLGPDNLRANNVNSFVITNPLSTFAETLRSAKIGVDLEAAVGARVVGIASSLPGEGKSTIASNFAQLLATQGHKTLLIDADLRNPGSTRALAPHAEAGLLETIIDGRSPFELLLKDPKTNLRFLPAVVKRRVPHSAELLSSRATANLLELARKHFDYVILDLPPIGPVVDAKVICPLVDTFLFVIEWGKTSRKMVRSTLLSEREIYQKCSGVILNKVDMDLMKLYRSYGSSEYYYSRYTSYYHEG